MAMNETTRRAVFLDKDGTLVEDVPYNVDPAQVRLMPGAVEGLRSLSSAGFSLLVITNQSGVARGLFSESALGDVQARISDLLAPAGIHLDGFYYCPHLPESECQMGEPACDCRKPSPGLLHRATTDHGLDLPLSWFVGDIADDIEAGRRAGCRTVLVNRNPESEPEAAALADYICCDLDEAAAVIIRESTANTSGRVEAGLLT
jgi:D-glycero-D-manno-heptose 1,7-bisphosphate phosphatase